MGAVAMRDHLGEFVEHVRLAPTEEHSERMVRGMLEEVARDCPMGLLVRLGQCIVNYRTSELRAEAERN
jgi:hypothetical protein